MYFVLQDEVSTLQLLKDHLVLEQTVENYAETVGMLSQLCQRLLEIGHPDRYRHFFATFFSVAMMYIVFDIALSLSLSIYDSEQITKQQSHIDRLYVSLKDMVEHRKTKLEQQYWLYQLNREVEELEKWITEREAVASSTELGQDLEHVTVSPWCEKRETLFWSPWEMKEDNHIMDILISITCLFSLPAGFQI